MESNKCEYMCLGRTLEIIHRLGDIDVFPKLMLAIETTTDDCKSQGTQWNIESYSRINDMKSMACNPVEGGN